MTEHKTTAEEVIEEMEQVRKDTSSPIKKIALILMIVGCLLLAPTIFGYMMGTSETENIPAWIISFSALFTMFNTIILMIHSWFIVDIHEKIK